MKKSILTGNSLNAKMAKLTASAEASMSNYVGELTEGKESFISASSFSGMSGNANGVVHKNRVKPIIIDISNTDENNELLVPIFSKFEKFPIPFNGVADIDNVVPQVGKGASVTIQGYRYEELQELSASRPFTLSKLRYRFGDSTQLDQPWRIRQKVGNSVANEPYYPHLSRALENQVSDTLVDEDFFMKVDGGATLLVKIAKAISATVARKIQVTLFIDAETDIANALSGQSVLSTFKAGK